MCSKFLKLAIITNDPSLLLLGAFRRRDREPKKFDFENYGAHLFKADFRFEKDHIRRLKVALDLPEVIRAKEGHKFSALEGIKLNF